MSREKNLLNQQVSLKQNYNSLGCILFKIFSKVLFDKIPFCSIFELNSILRLLKSHSEMSVKFDFQLFYVTILTFP